MCAFVFEEFTSICQIKRNVGFAQNDLKFRSIFAFSTTGYHRQEDNVPMTVFDLNVADYRYTTSTCQHLTQPASMQIDLFGFYLTSLVDIF